MLNLKTVLIMQITYMYGYWSTPMDQLYVAIRILYSTELESLIPCISLLQENGCHSQCWPTGASVTKGN